MTDYTDDAGVPLGRWVLVDREDFWQRFDALSEGVVDGLTVLAGRTDRDAGVFSRDWGLPGSDIPLLRSDFRGCDFGPSEGTCPGEHLYFAWQSTEGV